MILASARAAGYCLDQLTSHSASIWRFFVDIPSVLQTQVREGKAVLLLGAGASLEATDAKGNHPPSGRELAKLLSDRFLGGKFRDSPLNQVGEYAISESSLIAVQDFIRETLEPFQPTVAHFSLTGFHWAGLATTNYDRLIEVAYERQNDRALQRPRAFIENGDSVEDHMRDPRAVMLLKLHGCISRTSNAACPLILTTDQYITHRKGRDRIFDHLKGWSYERTIVFVGNSLQDDDLRRLLLETTEYSDIRPRYYAILRDVDPIEPRFWETKRVTILTGTFAQFMTSLELAIPASFRGLAARAETAAHPIVDRFPTRGTVLSASCLQFLSSDVDYVNSINAVAHMSPLSFYKGFSGGWAPVEQGLDVRRHLGDTILADHVLVEESTRGGGAEFILLKGHAGAGKSVLLRRIAWDAAKEYDRLCLFVRESGTISAAPIQELIEAARQRVYLFVDNAAERVKELASLAASIGPAGRHLTVFMTERTNEWNVSCDEINHLITEDYELKYLSAREIDALIALLDQHRALGTLEHADTPTRRAAFTERAGRQLLVALHEATLGRKFEDIIEDEFNSIKPLEAQRIYLTICVLHRLGVPVRAGIISRIHGVPFEAFKERLFAPLERVVYASHDPVIRDYCYRTRHSHVAEIVFTRVLRHQEERFNAYIRCLQELNVDYSADRIAFQDMVRGRAVLALFPSHELAKRVYDTAENHIGRDAHLVHQRAIYELNRANGNLETAGELLALAETLAPYDLAIKHSLAEHQLRLADVARTKLECDHRLEAAWKIAMLLKSKRSPHTFAHHTLVKIGLRKLRRVLEEPEQAQSDVEAEQLIKDIERNLADGLQRFPGDSYLLSAESELASSLADSARVLSALERAFAANPRNYQVASRLARAYRERGRVDDACKTLKEALDANPGEKRLHYAYAKFLLGQGGAEADELRYHLHRAYTPGDDSYDAQLLYGRQLFVMGDREGSRDVFRQLGQARVGPEFRHRVLYPLADVIRGRVVKLEATYCFVERDGSGDWVYGHRNTFEEDSWRRLVVASRVSFKVGFNFRGATAFDVQLIS